MIPHEKLATPGYEVNSVYSPANEVGGDFFHVQPASDGGLLVVIGDVAGKGLKAAMNVSMLMGALRRTQERSPAKILESLNRVLTGSDSLATCQAVWFGADGEIILANAGHLPPYLNSQEIELPGALPLGVLPEIHCDEVRFYLHPGDRTAPVVGWGGRGAACFRRTVWIRPGSQSEQSVGLLRMPKLPRTSDSRTTLRC